MNSSPGLSLAVTTGIAALVGGATAWKIKHEFKKLEESKRKDLSEVVHLIQIKDIGNLLDSENLEVQQYAEKLLKQRASSPQYLPEILNCCLSNDKDTVLKAVTAVFLLCTSSSNDGKFSFFNKSTLDVLLKVVKKLSQGYQYKLLVSACKNDVITEKSFHKCIGSIFHLTLNDPTMAKSLYEEKKCVRDILMHILSDHGFHILGDVKRWSTYIVHLLVQIEDKEVKTTLRKWGIITKATLCLIRYIGDLLLTQLCLQILVQYLGDTVDEIVHVCQEMASLGLMCHLVGLLRCEEEENIIQLSAIIIHHFCCFDIDVRNLSKIPGIIKILLTVLNSNEANIQKTVLRIFNYLCVSSATFSKKVLNEKALLKRLSVCLASGNKEVVQGSLMLLHDLAMPGKQAAQKVIVSNPDILKSLVSLALSSSGEQTSLIAETLGFFCSCESLHSVLLKQGVINAILHFTKSADTSVKFWASALILNLSMISDDIKEAIIRNGGLFILLKMAVSGDEVEMPDISSNATKALVILGFLDNCIDVKLSSGMDASIIIDGTEYCPGKQGINIVSLDFVNFKYSKGLVLKPEKFDVYLQKTQCESLKKWDPVFLVTQGDCTLNVNNDEVSDVFNKFIPEDERDSFLKSPVWAMLVSARKTRLDFGDNNLTSHFKLPFEECVSVVLKENFTDPLIDVLLSTSPSSTISKSEDLELIEILARHSYQRKAIISTAGFIEYLNEMIWSVIALQIKNIQEPENAVKLGHCTAALKIYHAFSIDEACLCELLNRGAPRVILCLLLSLSKFIQSTQHYQHFSFDREDSVPESEERFNSELDDEDCSFFTPLLPGTLQFENITASNDNIFYEEDETSGKITERLPKDEPIIQTSRRRADSYIVRADTKSRQRSESRLFDRSTSIEQQQPLFEDHSTIASPYTPSRRVLQLEEAANHQQMRRISRSMSISLQLSKSVVDLDSPEVLPGTDEIIRKLTRHSIMAMYHLISKADANAWEKLHELHFIPVLYNILQCFDETFKFEMGLPVSSTIAQIGRAFLKAERTTEIKRSHLEHIGSPKSLVFSTEKLVALNQNWFFESTRCNQPVSSKLYTNSKVAGWYFEVIIHSKGIMQIGWANEDCQFNPQKGIGVGDTNNSCGFDGTRCKVWSGPSVDVFAENDYGLSWQVGDVVSVLLSWDGVVSFWLNGKDLGPALKNKLNTSKLWYPAASLSIDQQCTFIFDEANMRYKKTTFVSVEDVYQKFNTIPSTFVFTSDELIKEKQTPNERGLLPELMYYFEVNLSQIKKIPSISIGYSDVRFDSSKHLIKGVSTDFLTNLGNKNTLGCGLVLQPTKQFVLTKGTSVIWMEPVSEFFSGIKLNDKEILDLVPFVSLESVDINIGQRCFVYEPANSNKAKQKFLSFVLESIDKEDN